MQGLIAVFMGVIGIGFYVVLAFILWKFYEVAAQIKNEIAEIKAILRDRLNASGGDA
jgi:hypothetical protein